MLAATSAPSTQPAVRHVELHKTVTKTIGYPCAVSLPPDYGSDASKRYPLIIYLHGSGNCGTDIAAMDATPVIKHAHETANFPFIVIAPQMPIYDGWWSVESLDVVLDHVLAEYAVDADRVYLTGASLGGYGAWDWACHRPRAFAAIAPIAGEGNDDWAGNLKDVPVWAFHGAKDQAVNPAEEERMVNAVNKVGGSAKLTMYPDSGHNAWTQTYANPEFYEWLLSKKRKGPADGRR